MFQWVLSVKLKLVTGKNIECGLFFRNREGTWRADDGGRSGLHRTGG
jgi:hypothetical protein